MGKLIAIDGLDGSGKGTQCNLLISELQAQGRNVKLISFPSYGSEAAKLASMYLQGKFGKNPDDTNAYAAATFFAIDRYISFSTEWKDFYSLPDSVIIANRYTTANAVHQLAKLDREDWDEYLSWLEDYEFVRLGIPKPDLVLFLEMKPEISIELTKKRSEETGQKLDIHELDSEYIGRCYKSALYASDKLGWTRIVSYGGKGPLPYDEVQAKISEKVTMLLDVTK